MLTLWRRDRSSFSLSGKVFRAWGTLKLIGWLWAFLAIPSSLWGQERGINSENPLRLTKGFGFAIGTISGSGFSYRLMPLSGGIGFQGGIIGFKTEDESYFNVGFEGLYVLNRVQTHALYLLAGLSYTRTADRSDSSGTPDSWEVESGISVGGGMGISYNFSRWERIWWSGDLVLRYYRDTLLPMPQFAVHYFFR